MGMCAVVFRGYEGSKTNFAFIFASKTSLGVSDPQETLGLQNCHQSPPECPGSPRDIPCANCIELTNNIAPNHIKINHIFQLKVSFNTVFN